MTDRYDDILSQLDGYTISSTLLSQTKVMIHHSESKTVKVFTTIYRNKPPKVEYMVSLNNGVVNHFSGSLDQAIAMYLGSDP